MQPTPDIDLTAADMPARYRVIGAGQNIDRADLPAALTAAERIRAGGWWVAVVDMPTRRIVAEYGRITDRP